MSDPRVKIIRSPYDQHAVYLRVMQTLHDEAERVGTDFATLAVNLTANLVAQLILAGDREVLEAVMAKAAADAERVIHDRVAEAGEDTPETAKLLDEWNEAVRLAGGKVGSA